MAKDTLAKPLADNQQTAETLSPGEDMRWVLSSSGARIDISSDIWQLGVEQSINWKRLPVRRGPVISALLEHVKNLIRTRSPDYVDTQFDNLRRVLSVAHSSGINVRVAETFDESFFTTVRRLLGEAYPEGTVANSLDAYRRWIVFCADEEFEGFDQEYATFLENLVIGGNLKGQAVLRQDANEGPLRFAQVAAIQGRLLSAVHAGPSSLDEFLVTWLSMSFGIYPRAMQFLNEEDLIRAPLPDGGMRYELRIPRLKKRGVAPRDEFHTRPVDPRVGLLFEQKISENRTGSWVAMMGRDGRRYQRPMFPTATVSNANLKLLETDFEEHAFRQSKAWFGAQLRSFAESTGLKAENGSMLNLNARRLRYTYATRLVREGASPAELADALDHTDLQHVMVYFNSRSDAVIALDKALALRLAPVAQTFMGVIIKDESEALRSGDPASRIHFADPAERKLRTAGSCGSFGFCGLNAHIACYTCFKFQPWLEGPHETVLDMLATERMELLERGVDLKIVEANDLTILAVAEVVRRCRAMSESVAGGAA
ncbi:site-specific integrase [Burkholderia pseudomallei]|uniref:site-specific integrase n=1 Tax=Burkholderia pseudomallei TaxID=28450 RepID=UPI0021F7B4B1|nr:site-specific integrase [Burkholderia pseudomallei]MCW0131856.1 site-specific integrase [Burkholderia pseudomallei]